MIRLALGSLAAFMLLLGSACGDDGALGGEAPQISVQEGSRVLLNGDSIAIGAGATTRLEISNIGLANLDLKGIIVDSIPPGAFYVDSNPLPLPGSPVTLSPDLDSHYITIGWDNSVIAERPTAKVTLLTSKQVSGDTDFVINVGPRAATARLVAQPEVIDFETVAQDTSSTKPVALLNTGDAPLSITRFNFNGHPNFTVALGDVPYNVTADSASTGITLGAPLVIQPGSAATIELTYTSAGEEAANAELTLFSDAGEAAIQMFANVAGPCINVNPTRVDFGGKLVGQSSTINVEIQSCGDRPLNISSVQFFDDAGGTYTLNAQALGVFPVAVNPNTSVYVPVTYTPFGVAAVGADGPTLDEGFFRITSDAYLADFDVEVRGFGTDGTCPTAVIDILQGEEVIPQTVLNLRGDGSYASSGNIAGYKWSVIAPSGSVSVFSASDTVANPTFEANVIGEYIFQLTVTDALGVRSCSQASKTVFVTSDEAIHIELLWSTPGDINQADEGFDLFGTSVGSDIDLHFTHPQAVGLDLDGTPGSDGWFDSFYDSYWQNKEPNWGSSGSADNPGLDRDDTDGGGPENLNLSQPETTPSNRGYRVGVHYWDDWGYGVSFATLRIYIYNDLRYTRSNVQMTNRNMWEVAEIAWPSGIITPIEAGPNVPKVINNYWNPIWGF